MKFNLFNKKENIIKKNEEKVKDQEVIDVKSESHKEEGLKAKLETKSPLVDKSLDEKYSILTDQKGKIKDLQKKRLEYYDGAQKLKAKLENLGLSKAQKQDVLDTIKKEGGDISKEINEIREKYGFEPTKREVLETRLEMLMKESHRYQEELAYWRILNNYVPDIESAYNNIFIKKMSNTDSLIGEINNIVTFLEKKFPQVKEVTEIFNIQESKSLIVNYYQNPEALKLKTEELIKVLKDPKTLQKYSVYHSKEDYQKATKDWDNLVRIIDKVKYQLKN